jgi:hypothetical protein
MHKISVEEKLREHKGVNKLLDLMEIHYLTNNRENNTLGNGLNLYVKEISKIPNRMNIGIYPVEGKPNTIWYGTGMKEILKADVLESVFGYCDEFSGPGIRFMLTKSRLKRWTWDLKDFADEVNIYLFLQPEKANE